MEKRKLGGNDGPPFTVGLVGLTESVDLAECLDVLLNAYPNCRTVKSSYCQYLILENFAKRVCFNIIPDCDLFALLEFAKVADFLIVVADASEKFSSYAEHAFSCLCAQGLPNIIYALSGLESMNIKKQGETKSRLIKVLSRRFPKLDRIYSIDNKCDAQVILRTIMTQKLRKLKFREFRASMLVDNFELRPPDDEMAQHQNLILNGVVRNRPLSANSLLYLPNLGAFQIVHVKKLLDPYAVKRKKQITHEEEIDYPDESQMSLECEAEVDPMEGEQTWPTKEDELSDDNMDDIDDASEYDDFQSAASQNFDPPEGAEIESSDESMQDCRSEIAESSVIGDSFSILDEEVEPQDKEREKKAREDQEFPDEVDTPFDIPARDRFQKYRGLQSFKHTSWDPKENLPLEYAKLFTFDSFKRVKQNALRLGESMWCVGQPGIYVEVEIAKVPVTYCNSLNRENPLVVFSLLQHEQKLSVCNFYLKRHPTSDEVVKSKDELVFWTPLRIFTAKPIFSEHTVGSKHKFLRYFHPDAPAVASIICPVTFGNCPVLVFRLHSNADDVTSLVATGSLATVDPYRVVVKRAVLSGYPYKVNKRYVVARYMFFNREDIMWFKPVELRTKGGRKGFIMEPLGTHGYMKCKFNAHIRSQDTVLLNLYKRVYPKNTYNSNVQEFGIDIPDSLIAGSLKSIDFCWKTKRFISTNMCERLG